jgi:hypothetical protein
VADTRLLNEPVFTIYREPDAPVRWALKLVTRRDTTTGNVIADAHGERIGSVRESARRWGFNLPDLELDVVDSVGSVVLALRADRGKLEVADQMGSHVGTVDWRNQWENTRGHRMTDMDVHFCSPTEEVGRLVPRKPPPRFQPRGTFEIVDTSGAVVARIGWHDIVREIVQLPTSVRDPLRSLVIAFACAQVDLDWITYRPRPDRRT